MVAAIMLARSLTPQDFARYSYFQLTVSMIGAYAALGLGTTASRYFAEVGHEGDAHASRPVGTLLSLSIIVSAAVGGLVLLLPEAVLIGELAMPSWLLAAGVVATALGVVPGGAILGLERYKIATLMSIGYGALILASAIVAGRYQAPTLAMGALVICALLHAVGQFLIAARVVGWQCMISGFFFRKQQVLDVTNIAGPLFLITLISASGSWIVGRILLDSDNGEKTFALYSIGLQWYSLALLIPGMISRVVLPRLIRSRAQGGTSGKVIIKTSVLVALGAAILVTGSAVLLGPWLGEIYGRSYSIDRLYIAAYMAAAAVSAPTNTLGNALHANNAQWLLLLHAAVWLVVLVTTSLVCVHLGLGEWGGSLAHGAAGLCACFLAYIGCRDKQLV